MPRLQRAVEEATRKKQRLHDELQAASWERVNDEHARLGASGDFSLRLSQVEGEIKRRNAHSKLFEPFFGAMELAMIMRSKVTEYRAKRGQDPIIRRGKIVQGKRLSFATINRELAFLRFLLNLAGDDGIIKRALKIELPTEKDRKRDRIASEEEYNALLSHMKRPAKRVLIGLYETAQINELRRITWDRHVDERAGFIRLKNGRDQEKKLRSIPISPALSSVLNELKVE